MVQDGVWSGFEEFPRGIIEAAGLGIKGIFLKMMNVLLLLENVQLFSCLNPVTARPHSTKLICYEESGPS